jgi:flagellar protein FlaF
MGFSVSGAAAIIFASMFIAFGAWYTAVDNSFQQIDDAEDDQIEGSLEAANTAIELSSAVYNASESDQQFEIRANNTGTTELSLNSTTLLLDSELEAGWQADAEVDSNGETDLWLPGEELVITLTLTEQPTRVKLATESGVAEGIEVERVT